MAGDIVVNIDNPDDIVEARKAGHQLALDLGFTLTDVTMIATAISEIARNITSYAGRGAVRVAVEDREGRNAIADKRAENTSALQLREPAVQTGRFWQHLSVSGGRWFD